MMKHIFSLLFYISVPIIGSGTEADPYRADIPPGLANIPGIASSAQIPSNPDGRPKFSDAIVWIPDRIKPPVGVVTLPAAAARGIIQSRDAIANPDAMERLK